MHICNGISWIKDQRIRRNQRLSVDIRLDFTNERYKK